MNRTKRSKNKMKNDSIRIPENLFRYCRRLSDFTLPAHGFIILLLIAALSSQLTAQSSSCSSCAKNKVKIRFASVICADKNINITLNGATASTQGGTCTTTSYATSYWTYTELTIDKTYTITAGSQICSTHIIFDVPDGYNLEINGEQTSEINKAGPVKGDGDGTWNIVLKKCKSCSGTSPGENCDFRNGSVEWSVGMGRLTDGRSAEAIAIREDALTAQIYTPAALIYSPPGKTSEVDVVRNADGSLRQVKAPQALADVVVISSTEYEVRYYRPADVGSKVGGIYTVTGAPFTVWKIKNPDVSTTNRLQISKSQNAVMETSEYQADSITGTWTLVRNGGLRSETKFNTYPTANSRVETLIVKDNTTQAVASKTEKTYYNFPWGEELIKEIVYPYDNSVSQGLAAPSVEASAVEVAPLVTEYAYYEDTADSGSYSKLKTVKRADGSWGKYFYDNFGNIRLLLRPWKDLTLENANEVNSRATYYYYTNFDGVITSLFNKETDHIDEHINGIRVKRTTYDRTSVTLNGEPAVREVQTVYSSAPVGMATVSTYYHRTASDFYASRTAFVEYPDGRKDTYIYERGDYTTNADPSLNQFTPNASGLAERGTVIHGTTLAPDGIPLKTTKETSVRNDKGQNALNEIYVYNGTSYERISWTVTDYNDASHPVQMRRSNGTVSTMVWTGDQLTSETDENGIQTTYTYDLLNRTKTRTKKGIAAGGGFPAQSDIVTTYGYDAEGRTTQETLVGGSLTLAKTRTYDLAGRIKTEKDEAGYSTVYDYTNGGRTQKITMPGGAYRVSDSYLSGQAKSQNGTAIVSRIFDYGVNADGTRYAQEFIGDAGMNSPRWTKTTADWAEQTIKIEKPGFVTGTNLIQTSAYNNKGQIISASTFAGATRIVADMLYEYDELGRQIRQGLDLNANGVLEISSTDRVRESEIIYEKNGSDWFRSNTTKNYLADNDAAAATVTQKERLTFISAPTITSETIGIDESGQSSRVTTTIDRASKKQTAVTNTAASGTDAVSISVNGLLQSSAPTTPETATVYAYDALGRATTTTSPQTGTNTRSYDATTGQLVSQSQGSQTTAIEYYPAAHQNAGRAKSQTNPNGKKVYFEYNLRGEIVRTWGDATYPMEYVFDAYGQQTELHTYRGGKGWQLANFPVSAAGTVDVTKWIYHEPTGVLNKKEDALGRQVVYGYDAANRLQNRRWARTDAGGNPLQTVYAYNANTGEMNTIDYSDATPDVTMTFDRGGRTSTVTDAAGSHVMTYNPRGEMAGDAVTGGILDGVNVASGFDEFLRRNQLQATSGANTLINQTYGYDASSRLETVSSNGQTATYGYYPTSGLLKTTTFTGGTNINRVYDSMGRMQSITNTPAVGTAQSYTYTYNNLNQRTRTTREDGSYWSYIYNERGELASGKKYWSDNAAVSGQQFEFGYDNIGNRQASKNGGDASGNNLRTSNYTANSLNQYSQRTVPGAVDVLGTSDAAATVTVNNQQTYRKGSYFQTVLNFDNSTNPVSSAVNVVGVKQNAGANGEDAVEQKTGSVYLPAATETYSYDLDGNLLTDGRWQYVWDAENRLSSMMALSNVPASAKKKLEFAYDGTGRRIQKKVYSWNTSASNYQLQSTTKFVYDGWNLIAELDGNNALAKSYVWGQDISGSLQKTGGIGGLLFIYQGTNTYQTGYDGNGNLTLLVKTIDGKGAAFYDYNPFGETLQENGADSQINPFRFSTKYTDSETNLIYYGYRYYNPQTGRWISRDPIEEAGGVNLYAFTGNNLVDFLDVLGRDLLSDYAYEKMIDLYNNHEHEVGREFSGNKNGRKDTDCITYIGHVLEYAYTKIGRKDIAQKIPPLKEKGTDLAAYLVSLGWKAHYFNPDTKEPRDGDRYNNHKYSAYLAQVNKKYYGVALSGWIINYNRTNKTTKTEYVWIPLIPNPFPWIPVIPIPHPITVSNDNLAVFNRLTKAKFAVGIARGGDHTFLLSFGEVYEVHWDQEKDKLYEKSPFYDYQWLSGMVVTPPESDFASDPIP
jgi:RHS repeat-associated protein